jgi:hypothetical protein
MGRVETAIQILTNNMIDASTRERKDSLNVGIQGKLEGTDIYLSNKKVDKIRSRYQ